jgi:membrane fusion protein (multidrug efflux system)
MRWLIAWTVVLGLGCSMGPKQGGEEEDSDAPEIPITVVDVAPVALGSVAERIEASAAVESVSSANLSALSGGMVLSVEAEEGDPVRKGQELATLDNSAVDAGAERASTDLLRLERELATTKKLLASGAASERDVAEAEYQLSLATTQSKEARRSQNQTKLVAPFAGVVASRTLHVGEILSPGQTAFEVVDPDNLRVVATLPEREIGRVSVGQKVKLTAAYGDRKPLGGTVLRTAPVVDARTGTFRVTIGVDPSEKPLHPGQFVTVGVEVSRHDDVVAVPRDALVYEDGIAVAYTMVPAPKPEKKEKTEAPKARSWWPFSAPAEPEKDEKPADTPEFVAKRLEPKVGLVDGDTAEILSGLAPGDPLVVLGQSALRDGSPIETPVQHTARLEKKKAAEEAAKESKKSGTGG